MPPAAMIPLLHDRTDETVLAFGGKDVGARKDRRQRRRPPDGPVTVAVARDGTSPALARELRRRIEPAVEPVTSRLPPPPSVPT